MQQCPPDSGRCALASFEPHHSKEIRPGDNSETSQPDRAAGTLRANQPDLSNATETPQRTPKVLIRHPQAEASGRSDIKSDTPQTLRRRLEATCAIVGRSFMIQSETY